MRDPQFVEFLESWHQVMIIAAIIAGAICIFTFIYHKVKVSSLKSYKDQWDYINTKEAKNYMVGVVALVLVVFFLLNTYDDETVALSHWWFVIRIFISGAIATLIAYIAYLVLKFYYPGKLQKKLNILRYKPRISSSGNQMKLLSEEEEDVHLDEGMQAEENVFSVDYDVWVDQMTGEVKIEKYPGELEALKCNTCNFQTMRLVHEEIIKEATKEEEGQLLKHYQCAYCKSKRTTQHTIAKVIDSLDEYKIPEDAVFVGDRKVKSIMMEILDTKGDTREFYFQNIKQAKQFLEEFDFDKLPEE